MDAKKMNAALFLLVVIVILYGIFDLVRAVMK